MHLPNTAIAVIGRDEAGTTDNGSAKSLIGFAVMIGNAA
jgi:hypothetical protein